MMTKRVSDGVYRVLDTWGPDVAVYLYRTGASKCERCGSFPPDRTPCSHIKAAMKEGS